VIKKLIATDVFCINCSINCKILICSPNYCT